MTNVTSSPEQYGRRLQMSIKRIIEFSYLWSVSVSSIGETLLRLNQLTMIAGEEWAVAVL